MTEVHSLPPRECIEQIQKTGLNLTEISRQSDIALSILSTVRSGKRKWIHFSYVDRLRALLNLRNEIIGESATDTASAPGSDTHPETV